MLTQNTPGGGQGQPTIQPGQKPPTQQPGVVPMTPPAPRNYAGAITASQSQTPPASGPNIQSGQQGPASPPAPTPGITPMPAPQAPQSVGYGQTQGITPGQDLRGQTITPGAESNRLGLANQYLDTYRQNQLPQFQHDLRGIVQGNAATGRLGSGMLNTDVGNLELASNQNYNSMASNLLTGAMGDQITDNANYRNELRGERGYENELETQAYDRNRQGILDQNDLTNSAFGRAATTAQMGYGGNPAEVQQALSGYYGNQASQSGQALGGLIAGQSQNSALLKALGMAGGSGGQPQGTSAAPQSGLTPELMQYLGTL